MSIYFGSNNFKTSEHFLLSKPYYYKLTQQKVVR